uniref:Uncharacterized protein n=1 Tax=Populus trichocarpa TaxID=3694 RepID=A0A2K2BID2_POPTR
MMAYSAHHMHSTRREICKGLTPKLVGIVKVARKQAFSSTNQLFQHINLTDSTCCLPEIQGGFDLHANRKKLQKQTH